METGGPADGNSDQEDILDLADQEDILDQQDMDNTRACIISCRHCTQKIGHCPVLDLDRLLQVQAEIAWANLTGLHIIVHAGGTE